ARRAGGRAQPRAHRADRAGLGGAVKEKPSFADAVVEDYVKVIHQHTEWQPEPITTSVLAARLGLAASSVTEMVKKLAASGLVVHVPYGAVTLTADRRVDALTLRRRHLPV